LTLDRKIRRLQGQARQSERFHVKTLIRKTGNRLRGFQPSSHSLFTLSKNIARDDAGKQLPYPIV
jgi:hypothetical protein